jgi:hypothetical protein
MRRRRPAPTASPGGGTYTRRYRDQEHLNEHGHGPDRHGNRPAALSMRAEGLGHLIVCSERSGSAGRCDTSRGRASELLTRASIAPARHITAGQRRPPAYLMRWFGGGSTYETGCRALPPTPPAAAPGAVLAPAPVPAPAAAMAAAAAEVPAAAAVAVAAAPPVRATAASALRVPAALLDQHLERGLAPSCRAPRRRAPRAHGNDLRAPGDDSPAEPSAHHAAADLYRRPVRLPAHPYEPDPGDLSTPAERHAGAPDWTGVPIVLWTWNGLRGGAIRWSARTGTRGGRGGSSCPGRCVTAPRHWRHPRRA